MATGLQWKIKVDTKVVLSDFSFNSIKEDFIYGNKKMCCQAQGNTTQTDLGQTTITERKNSSCSCRQIIPCSSPFTHLQSAQQVYHHMSDPILFIRKQINIYMKVRHHYTTVTIYPPFGISDISTFTMTNPCLLVSKTSSTALKTSPCMVLFYMYDQNLLFFATHQDVFSLRCCTPKQFYFYNCIL